MRIKNNNRKGAKKMKECLCGNKAGWHVNIGRSAGWENPVCLCDSCRMDWLQDDFKETDFDPIEDLKIPEKRSCVDCGADADYEILNENLTSISLCRDCFQHFLVMADHFYPEPGRIKYLGGWLDLQFE